MNERTALTANDSAAMALKQVNPDVAAVFPITPQTELMHKFSQYVADGDVDTELINVESEHSAMSATVGAAAAGARSVTATSANGLALMWEILYIASSLRLPIVMPEVNRALSGNINIHCDHSDTMGARDAGWIQFFSENAQEAYDNVIQAFRIAEHKDVLLPAMATLDGFILSHTMETLDVFKDDKNVTDFVGEYSPAYSLLEKDPITVGPLDLQDFYFEHKRAQYEAMTKVPAVVKEVAAEYKELSGREYGFVEKYLLDDADVAVVVLGSTAGTARTAIDNMRKKGIKAGMLKIRMFRPFPAEEVVEALTGVSAIGIMDRSISFGAQAGPVFLEMRCAAYETDLLFADFIYGLGGRDVPEAHVEDVIQRLVTIAEKGKVDKLVDFIGVRD